MNLTDNQKQILKGKICPYCNNNTLLVDSSAVYGRSYGMIYYCKPCKSWCGVHKGSSNSLGRLANSELREAKKEAHKYFDQVWKLKYMTRSVAYKWLSEKLNIPAKYTHIGMFSVNTCKNVIKYSMEIINKK